MPRALLALSLTIAFAGPVSAQQKGRKVAFLVGVGEFKHDLPNLNGSPQKDVTALAAVFREGGFDVVILKDAEATRANVEKRFKAVIEGDGNAAKSLGKNDLLLVTFCTHGFSLHSADGKKDEPFLAAHDSKLDKPGTMVSLNSLIDEGKASGATVLYLLDACREMNDANRGATRGIEGDAVKLPKGTAVMFSCGRGQVSHQSDKADGHGLFTSAVLKVLRGQAGLKDEVTWTGLVFEVEKTFRSPEFQKFIPPGKPQTPIAATGELPYTDLLTIGGPLAEDIRGYDKALAQGELQEYLRRQVPTRLEVWRAYAEAGNPTGQFLYGRCFLAGIGVPKNDTHAVEWFRKSANGGNAFGMNAMGAMFQSGQGVAKDEVEAVKWMRQAAEAGNARAMGNMGGIYANGRGVGKDNGEAVKWYQKAATAGDPQGTTQLGWMYANGLGVQKDELKAIELYRKAADLGDHDGMNKLGWVYGNGLGVVKDDVEAVKWYRKAAEVGNPFAMTNLGAMYEVGRGVAKDEAEAVKWYQKAAALGNTDAKVNLKRLHKD